MIFVSGNWLRQQGIPYSHFKPLPLIAVCKFVGQSTEIDGG